jgi:hypothetical protein
MLEIGRAGQRGLVRAREHVRYQFLGGPEPSVFRSPVDHYPDIDDIDPLADEQESPNVDPATSERTRVASAAPERRRVSIDAEAEELEVETPDTKTSRR